MEPDFPILTALILVPAVGALAVALVPNARAELHRGVALMFSVATGALAVYLLAAFDKADAGYQFETNRSWISDFGISWHLGVDGISLFLIVLTAVLFPIALLGSTPHHDAKSYYAWLLLLEAGCLGVFVALDLFLFFVMFELTLVPMYFLIGGWGYANRVYAALKFFLYTFAGSTLMLISIIAVVWLYQDATGTLTFDLTTLANPDTGIASVVSTDAARWMFLGFTVAFAVKVPIFPLHTWLPDAHTEAPTAGSVIL